MKKGYLFIPETAEEIKKVEDFWYGRNQNLEQKKIIPVCAECGKTVDQKVVNYCKHPNQKDRFNGKIYCKECQEDK